MFKLKISFLSQRTGDRVTRQYESDNPNDVINWFNKYGIGTFGLEIEEMVPAGFMVIHQKRVRV
jgi:hypothetical protein